MESGKFLVSPTSNNNFVRQQCDEMSEKGFKRIVEICERHVMSQTRSVQEIVNVCSKITGFEFYCNQIVAFCNQIFSETLNNRHTIINLCRSFTGINFNASEKNSVVKTGSIGEVNLKSRETQLDRSYFSDGSYRKDSINLGPKTQASNVESTEILNNKIVDETLEKSEEIKTKEDDKPLKKKTRKSHPVKLLTKDENTTMESKDEDEPDDLEEGVTKTNGSGSENFETKANASSFIDHLGNEVAQSPDKTAYTCCYCGKKYKTKSSYEQHEKKHSQDGNEHKKPVKEKKTIPIEELTCEYCGHVSSTRKNIREHIRTHTGEKPYVCEICGNCFGQDSTFRAHKLTHVKARPVKCELCDYRCLNKRRLQRHMNTHSNEKKYQCDECGNRYAWINSLQMHMNVHAGIKPHACDQCNKRFTRRSHMLEHRKIHTEEMPYSCPICGKRSRQEYNITVHMRTHTGHKPFSCDTCSKMFAHKVSLRQHKVNCTRNASSTSSI